ncbi:ABC transporter ATP-binding protein [Trueperella sp. LYQ143]|uniref:ABC transporter ATP-binding protein n=1 Tax=unclassified Trueperella TaxID=2630174 RepID=UPI003982FBDC
MKRLPIAQNYTIMRRMLALFMQFRREFLIATCYQIIVAVAAVITPWVIGKTFDAVAEGTSLSVIRVYICVLVVAMVLNFVFTWLGEYRSRVLGEKAFCVIRVDLVRTLMHLPLSVVEEAGTGDLLGRSTTDVSRVEGMVRYGLVRLLVTTLEVVVIAISCIAIDWRIGLVAMIAFLPQYFVARFYLRRSIAGYLAISSIHAELAGDTAESVEHSASIDAFAMQEYRERRTRVIMQEIWDNDRYTAWMRVMFLVGTFFVVNVPTIIAIVWGAALIGWGGASIGAVVSIALLVRQANTPVEIFCWWIDELQYSMVALARIFGVSEVLPDRTVTQAIPDGDRIEIRDVSFSYHEGDPVLHEVSLAIRPGERLAIVGPSGAGKTTLGRLIAGINPPDHGEICVGGVNVMELEEKLLHSTVSLVTQENHIFSGTIADNLRFARAQATDSELREALLAVHAQWIDQLEDGIETEVGSGNYELTPAQAQQLALARIVLVDPDVVILDEATSLLDPRSARSAEQALNQVLTGRTVISIAHRLYTAYDADRIVVMIDGRVTEVGSHHELVAQGGEYAKLWQMWQSE